MWRLKPYEFIQFYGVDCSNLLTNFGRVFTIRMLSVRFLVPRALWRTFNVYANGRSIAEAVALSLLRSERKFSQMGVFMHGCVSQPGIHISRGGGRDRMLSVISIFILVNKPLMRKVHPPSSLWFRVRCAHLTSIRLIV